MKADKNELSESELIISKNKMKRYYETARAESNIDKFYKREPRLERIADTDEALRRGLIPNGKTPITVKRVYSIRDNDNVDEETAASVVAPENSVAYVRGDIEVGRLDNSGISYIVIDRASQPNFTENLINQKFKPFPNYFLYLY